MKKSIDLEEPIFLAQLTTSNNYFVLKERQDGFLLKNLQGLDGFPTLNLTSSLLFEFSSDISQTACFLHSLSLDWKTMMQANQKAQGNCEVYSSTRQSIDENVMQKFILILIF